MNTKNVWSSKWVFILATIGAAAGLGNLWRFPYITYENGGGAFVFAYLVCLFLIAKPIMMTEFALAQTKKKNFIDALGEIAKGFGKFVGWMSVSVLLLLGTYYGVIIAWGFDFLFFSELIMEWGVNSQEFFHNEVLNLSSGIEEFGGFSQNIIWGLVATFLAVYFSIFKGLKSVGAVVKWTVPLPFLFLVILFLNSLTLDGATEGFKYFLVPDWSKLASIELWKNAISMCFFSTSVGLILNYFYAQFNHEKNDIAFSAWWVGIGDLAVSLVAGLAMFGTLGYVANSQGVEVSEVVTQGTTLAFVSLPSSLAALPFGQILFAILFFLTILMLGIDSMFALVETVLNNIKNQFKKFQNISHKKFLAWGCVFFFLTGLIYAGGNGLYRLDIVDHFIFGHLFFISTTLQIIIFGWIYGAKKIREKINSVSTFMKMGSWFDIILKIIAPIILIYLYISSLPKEFSENYGDYSDNSLLLWGVAPMIAVVIISILLANKKHK